MIKVRILQDKKVLIFLNYFYFFNTRKKCLCMTKFGIFYSFRFRYVRSEKNKFKNRKNHVQPKSLN
jgi:hypothetical protein